MRNLLITLIFSSLLGAGAALAEQAAGNNKQPHDAEWVQQKAKTCASCHGPKGVSQTPNFPIIAGQHQNYLLHSMKGYRDGERKNAVMVGQVKGLTDAQLKALAKFYARQESPLYTPALGQ